MTRTSTPSSAQAALLAGLVVVATASGAFAMSLDNSTTDATSTTSDILAGDTLVLNATTNDTHTVEAIVGNSTTPELKIVVNGTTYERNTSMTEIATGSQGTHFNGTISEAPLLDVPIAAGGNVSANLVVYNASNTSDELVNETIYIESDGTYATTDEGDTVQTESTGGVLASVLGSDDETPAAGTEATVSVTENTTDVRYAPQNASMQTAISEEVAAHDSSAPLWTVQLSMDGEQLVVVTESQDTPSWLDTESDTYAVAHDDGTVVVKNANVSSAGDVTLEVVGADKTNFLTQVDTLQAYGVSTTQSYWKASIDYNGNPDGVDLAT